MKKITKEKYMAMYLCRKEIEEEEEIIRMLRRNLKRKNEQYLKREEEFYNTCKHELIFTGIQNDNYHNIEIKIYRYYCPICRYDILHREELPNTVYLNSSVQNIEDFLEKILIDDIEGVNELFKRSFSYLIGEDADTYQKQREYLSSYIKRFGYEILDSYIVRIKK